MFCRRGDAAEEERKMEEEKGGLSEEEEDLEAAMKKAASSAASRGNPAARQRVPGVPEAAEDFLRNFLRRAGLSRTLRRFEAEWYGSAQGLLRETLPAAAAPAPGAFFIPDALTHGHALRLELCAVRGDAERLRREAAAAAESLRVLRKERDFHRMQRARAAEQKNRLLDDVTQLRKHLQCYQRALKHVEDRYQSALRQKTLIGMEKERLLHPARPEVRPGENRKTF